ncbi:MAG: hypothetical protein M3355_06065 [Actinomycetota bacterium]|nr:hypothetical protein [Actinomycetota bacterium]
MNAVEALDTRSELSGTDRTVAAFLWTLMALGSVAMWVGVPAGWLWVAGQITSVPAQHIVLSVLGVPLAIIIWARGLFWLNRLHMRVTMPRLMREIEEADDDEEPRTIRGPLEPLLVGSLVVAIVAMAVWFFFFAERPPPTLSTS